MTSINKIANNQKSINTGYQNIKHSGDVATIAITTCCLTGIKKIKVPHKQSLHKISGILALLSTIWHIGAIKQWDKFFK